MTNSPVRNTCVAKETSQDFKARGAQIPFVVRRGHSIE
jgi:hypothetical protein